MLGLNPMWWARLLALFLIVYGLCKIIPISNVVVITLCWLVAIGAGILLAINK